MPVLTVHDLWTSHADQEVLTGVTFSLEPGERAGLIGRNGTGKTTLLEVLADQRVPDRGRITRAGWARVAYLAQTPSDPVDATVLGHVLAGAADVRALEARVRDLEHLMATPEVHDDAQRLADVMEEYGRVHERFVRAGGFELETRARVILSGLGFREADHARPLRVLSGGWRVRAELARALLLEPDVLLLDEPTNHLDLAAIEWLEASLAAFPGAAIVVSHDRYFLDAVTSRTLELEDGRIDAYTGAYTAYARQKAERVARQQEQWERQQEEMARLEDYIRRYRAGNRATQAKSRERMLARVTARPVERVRERAVMRVRADTAPASGRLVVRLRGVAKRFGDREVVRGLDLEVHRGERIGLIGPNGAGKTTLLRVIAGLDAPSAGHVSLGVGVRPGYFAQESASALDPEHTVLDEILGGRPMTPEQVRSYLGRFLFSGEDVFKRVGMLSGGERQRLSLALLLLEHPNLLLLDEPTNHLDIPSREALEGALQEFPGTMIVATHDRYLLERLATRIVTLDGAGVTDFRGTYHDLRARVAAAPAPPRRAVPKASRRTAAARSRGPSFDEIAARIAVVERDLGESAAWLADPELYRDAERARAVRRRYEEAEQALAKLYEELAVADAAPPEAER